MENDQQPGPVKQYGSHIEWPAKNITLDFVGQDLNEAKENIQLLCKGQCRFEGYGSNNATVLVFHPAIDGGKKAMGWINTFEVPGYLSTHALLERRTLQAA